MATTPTPTDSNAAVDAPARPKTRNRAICLTCKNIIESQHGHDFRTCQCGAISVDGGGWYHRAAFDHLRNLRWLGNREPTPDEQTCASPVVYGYRMETDLGVAANERRGVIGLPVPGTMHARMEDAIMDAAKACAALMTEQPDAQPWVEMLDWRRADRRTFVRADTAAAFAARERDRGSPLPTRLYDRIQALRIINADATEQLPPPPPVPEEAP